MFSNKLYKKRPATMPLILYSSGSEACPPLVLGTSQAYFRPTLTMLTRHRFPQAWVFFQSSTKFISYSFHCKELLLSILMLLFLNVIIIKISCTIFNNRKPSPHLSSRALTHIMHALEIYLWDFNLSIIVVCEQAQWVRALRLAKWFCLECYNYY